MYNVSDDFVEALSKSHRMIAKAEVYNGVTLLDTLKVSDGSVNIDKTSKNRRRFSATLYTDELVPNYVGDLLHPLSGNEVKVYRGISLPTTEQLIAYEQAALANRPLALWHLDSDGIATDLVTGIQLDEQTPGSGDIVDSATYETDGNKAYRSNSVNEQFLDTTSPRDFSDDVSDGLTLCAWVNTRSLVATGAHQFPTLINLGWVGSGTLLYTHVDTIGDYRIRFGIAKSGVQAGVTTPTVNNELDEWKFVVGVFDRANDTFKIIVNMITEQSITNPIYSDYVTSVPFTSLGRATNDTITDQFGWTVFGRPLSDEEIQAMYDAVVNQELAFETTWTDEYVPLGVFGIEDSDIEDTGDRVEVKITGVDRSKEVEENNFTQVYFIAEGTNFATAIKDIIDDRRVGTVFNFMNTTRTTPPMILGYGSYGASDPWGSVVNLASYIGAEIFFDADGICVLRPEPDTATSPTVAQYREGADGNIVISANKRLTKKGVINKVIAFGLSPSGDPVRVEVTDPDSNLPERPMFLRTTQLFTESEAIEAAEAELRRRKGTPTNISFKSIVNPALDVSDVINIRRSRLGVDLNVVLDKIDIPLSASGSLDVVCREQAT